MQSIDEGNGSHLVVLPPCETIDELHCTTVNIEIDCREQMFFFRIHIYYIIFQCHVRVSLAVSKSFLMLLFSCHFLVIELSWGSNYLLKSISIQYQYTQSSESIGCFVWQECEFNCILSFNSYKMGREPVVSRLWNVSEHMYKGHQPGNDKSHLWNLLQCITTPQHDANVSS